MCKQCWDPDQDTPVDWNPRIERALELIRIIYETEAAGGPMHIVLDDWNIEEDHLEFCRIKSFQDPAAKEATAGGIDAFAIEATIELVPLMLEMSYEERATTLAYKCGYLTRPSDPEAQARFEDGANWRDLLRRNTEQEEEIARLRARIAELEQEPKAGE